MKVSRLFGKFQQFRRAPLNLALLLLTLTIALFVTSSCVNIYQLEPADPSLPADQNVLTSGEEFTFFGDGQPGSQIEIVVDEQVVGEVTVDAAGSWSYPLNFDAPGDYRLQVRTLDPYDQQVANTSSPVTLTVYAPPTLSVPTVPDSLTAGDDLQVAGTGQPGRSVEIIVDGETVDTVTIDDDGRWRYRVAFDEPGDFEIQTRLAASGDSQSTSLSEPLVVSVAEPEPEPVQPTLSLPTLADDLMIGDQLTLSGNGGPGDELEILINEEVVDTVTVSSLGRWSYRATFDEPGDYQFQVRLAGSDDEAGITSTSNPLMLSVAPEPVQPTVSLPTLADDLTTDDQISLSGTGGPGDELEILIDGEVVDTVTVSSLGRWTYRAAFDEPGDYELQVQLLDSDGEASLISEPLALSIAPPPVQPTVSLPTLVDDLTTGDQITLSGSGGPGDELEILVNGEVVDTITINSLGRWTYRADFDEAGDYELQVQLAGRTGPNAVVSEPLVLSIAPEPVQPTLSLPTLTEEPTTEDQLSLSGTGSPGDEIEILVDGEVVDTITVNSLGRWTYRAGFDEPGDYELQAQLAGSDGAEGLISEPLTVSIVEPEPEPVQPTLTLPTLTDEPTTADRVSLSGTGGPGDQLEVLVDGEVVDTITVNSLGRWSYRADFDEAGDYELQVQLADSDGAEGLISEPLTVSIIEPEPEAVQPTISLPTLADEPTTADQVALSGTGGPGDELEILVDGEVVDTVTVNSLGRWSYQAAFDEAGDYELQVQLADSDAAEGLASEPVALSIVPAPVQPTLTLPTLPDEPTTADQISLSGTGGPGDALEVLVNGELVDTITVDSLGNWSYQADFEAAGDYQLQVQLVDSDGEAIAVSDPLSVSVAEPLTAPTILFPKAGGDVIAGRLTIIGTADPEAEVEVLNGDELLGTTEADADGEWLYTLDVTPDAYQFQARLTADNSLTSETLDTQVVFASAGYDCTINAGINRGDDYIVGVCDTMGTIIQDLDIEFEALLEANTQIENPDLIYPGEILVIPQ